MIKQAEKDYSPQDLEKRISEFWKRTRAYEKSRATWSKGEDLYFVDGPPYTTGSIHLGTALNKVIKDCFVRYKRMSGFNVRDQPGYDMHGLPIEIQVEKSLGITNKKEIEEFGVERFVTTCREFSLSLLKKQTEQFASLGVWLDWDNPYMTIKNSYIEAAWWTLKRASERKLLVEAQRALQWCTRCETALAEAEIEYWDETDPSVYVKFPLLNRDGESVLIWTTTPWTLPGNMAVAVHPDFTYAKALYRQGGVTEAVWVLESNVAAVMEAGGIANYRVVQTLPGERMVGWEYVHPLERKIPYHTKLEGRWVHKVVSSETVTSEHTGLVHTAPGHGPEDFDIGQKHRLPIFSPVDGSGRYTSEAGDYVSMYVRDANATIISDLKAFGYLFSDRRVAHRYGHCWRCHTPIIFRATTQWFLNVTAVKQRMLDEIARIGWTPDWAGSARQYEWTMNIKDWCISRQRYWGIPLPIWRCGKCGEMRIIGSSEELKDASNYTEGMDLHRPWIDAVAFTCEKCGDVQRRVNDILDVWFDSGVASWAQLEYPLKTDEFERWWPVDFITEAHDQTRGWFNSQLTAGIIAFDRSPYENVLMHGWMNGPDGQPMSKSLGNYVEPEAVIQMHGVDSLRFYLLKASPPWEDMNFQMEEVRNANRTLNMLWNVCKFATMYMAMDNFDPEAHELNALAKHTRPEDRWLLSRIEGLKLAVTREMDAYNLHKAARALEEFIINDLSRWYVKLVRDRTWVEGEDESKWVAYKVLHEALTVTSRLLAPFCPYVAEAIYQSLDGRCLTVHVTEWPELLESRQDPELERGMQVVQELVEEVTKARQRNRQKLRWPIASVTLKDATPEARKAMENLRTVFLSQINCKDVKVLGPGEILEGVEYTVKPNPDAIGRIYKQFRHKIATILESRPGHEIKRELEEKGEYKLGIEGQMIRIEPGMVEFQAGIPFGVEILTTTFGELYVDFRKTSEIEAEGLAREIIRRIQQMRKDIDLAVEDYVRAAVQASPDFLRKIGAWRDHISKETRCRSLALGEGAGKEEFVVAWNIDGEQVTVGITPLHMAESISAFLKIPGMNDARAVALLDAGYRSYSALQQATREELATVEGLSSDDALRIKEFVDRRLWEARPPECPVCGAEVETNVKTCWRCDETLQALQGCPSCGRPLAPTDTRCRECGADLAKSLEQAASAERPAEVPLPELKESSTYLVKEEVADRAYALFLKATSGGKRGYCITRIYPQKAREKYGLKDAPILWLSNVGKEDSVRPKDIEKLSLSLEQFITREKGVVLLDGLEYLITNNNFLTVLRLVQSLRDRVAINKAILLVPVNPATLDAHQTNLLEREVDHVIDLVGVS